MTIYTKYNVHDEVYFITNNIIQKATVIGIEYTTMCVTPEVKYHLMWRNPIGKDQFEKRYQSKVFASKNELLQSL